MKTPTKGNPGKVAPMAEKALRRAARAARKIARMYGTPIYICRDGKVVALKP